MRREILKSDIARTRDVRERENTVRERERGGLEKREQDVRLKVT